MAVLFEWGTRRGLFLDARNSLRVLQFTPPKKEAGCHGAGVAASTYNAAGENGAGGRGGRSTIPEADGNHGWRSRWCGRCNPRCGDVWGAGVATGSGAGETRQGRRPGLLGGQGSRRCGSGNSPRQRLARGYETGQPHLTHSLCLALSVSTVRHGRIGIRSIND